MKPLSLYRRHVDGLAARIEAEVAERLEQAPEAAAELAQRLMDDELTRRAARSSGPQPECAAGCSFCCHVHVETTEPELLAIAAFVETSMAVPARAALEQRLVERVAQVDGLSDEARWAARVPCALLEASGRCSIYAARPLRCRAFHSCSRDTCRAAFEGTSAEEPPLNRTLVRAADAVEAGYDRALAARGQSTTLRLERGLLELWPRPRPDGERVKNRG